MERQSRVQLLRAIVLMAGGLLLPMSTTAAAPVEQKSINVAHAGEDTVGVSLVQAIKDELGRSATVSYTVVGNHDLGTPT
jgi:hypothetical protein